jgi:hypothetical protein
MKHLFFLCVNICLNICLGATAMAISLNPIEAIGPHYPIFIVEKNVNPQNQMLAYTKLNSACEFVLDETKNPIFDFYWLMNGKDYKVINSIIKSQIRNRLAVVSGNQNRSFYASINDLKELNTDLKDARMTITSRTLNQGCVVEGFMTLGPSDNNALVKVSSIYTEGEGTLRPRVLAVTIKGTLVESGQPIKRTYRGR